MALAPFLTEEEYSKIASHIESEVGKALGVEYRKGDDGKYYLVVQEQDGWALENVTGLRNSVEATREERDQALAKLKKFGDVDPAKLPEILDKAKKFDEMDPDAEIGKLKTQFEEWKEELLQQKDQEKEEALAAERQRAERLKAAYEEKAIVAEATSIMSAPEIKGNPALLLPIIRDMTEVVEEDGQFRVRVLNPTKPGRERIGKDGGPMTLEELIHELRQDEKYAGAFEGSGKSGGGTPPEGGGTGGGEFGAKKRSEMTDEEKAAFIHERGMEEFTKLPL